MSILCKNSKTNETTQVNTVYLIPVPGKIMEKLREDLINKELEDKSIIIVALMRRGL